MNRGMKISLIVILSVIAVGVLGLITVAIINRVQNGTTVQTLRVPPGMGILGQIRRESENNAAQPLTVDQAKTAVDAYLAQLNNPDLELKEIMVFQNNAYARIVEKSTGIGAMELLVDPATLQVYPEYGANMMWNLKYGMMGTRRGMMGSQLNPQALTTPFTMTVSSDQAIQIAQNYLDQVQPGTTADPQPDEFYGYYTIDILQNNAPIGMLSVNGYTGQIILHTWHGTFITMQEY